jgi:ATP-binding cassette, subfamily B, bacterial PglK
MIDLATWKKAWGLLSASEKRNSLIVLVVIILGALSSAVMVGSVIPFLSVLADPSLIEEKTALAWAYDAFGFTSVHGFLIGLGLASFVIIILSSILQIIKTWAMARFATMRQHSISLSLLASYLSQPYSFFLNRHSSGMGPRVLDESQRVVLQFFRPVAELIAGCLTTLAILGLLIWVEPIVAVASFALLGSMFGLIYITTRRILKRLGQVRLMANRQRYRFANEALNGIKDIKLLGREAFYLDRFKEPSIRMSKTDVEVDLISQVPHFVLQTVALGGVILLCLVLIDPAGIESGAALGGLLPVLGVFAFAGQRLMPELSKIYQSLAYIQAASATVNAVHEDFVLDKNLASLLKLPMTGLGLKHELRLDSVSYSYPNSNQAGVRNISLSIHAGEKIGIVGSTGAGKTTLADVILGLLEPNKGQLVADGAEITSGNVRAWMQSVSYVPQDIFLTDASVTENIALGVQPEAIDHERIRSAARIARIDQFIIEDLPHGYETSVGERGVRLSGGQRQRLGIARALYHDADLIVFDEATSALDNLTEAEVIEAIDALPGDKTVLMIAHRLTTVKRCDRIIVLENGHIVGCDSWDGLMTSNASFERLEKGSARK